MIQESNVTQCSTNDKLAFVEELFALNIEGKLSTSSDKAKATHMLAELRAIVIKHLKEELIDYMTDIHTEYYAPEYTSWRECLLNTYALEHAECERILWLFDEDELECMWQNSHITEELTTVEVQKDIIHQIEKIKRLENFEREFAPMGYLQITPEQEEKIKNWAKARIRGLYHLIHEVE